MKILVTGATGLVGSNLLPLLARNGCEVVAGSRTSRNPSGAVEWRIAPELGPYADWLPVLRQVRAVVHLAGRARIARESTVENEACCRINTEGTSCLARQAAASGATHFLFLSSCHAVAAESDAMITAETRPVPASAYGRSKLAAEDAVKRELRGSGCAWTILRPPAVYGPGCSSSVRQLARLAFSPWPLPFASVRNRRSFIYVGNLADAIAACVGNPQAFGKTFQPADEKDVSTPELIRAMARANQGFRSSSHGATAPDKRYPLPAPFRSPRLFRFPQSLLAGAGRLPGFGALRKLTSSLYVDSEPLHREIGWRPSFTLEEGLWRMGQSPAHTAVAAE